MSDDIIKMLRERIDFERDGGMTGRWIKLDELAALLDRLDQSEKERATLWEAIGLASTIKGDMEIDTSDPLGMMQQVARHADGLARENERLRAENERLRRSQSRRVGYVCEQCGWTLSAEPAERDAADR